MIVLDTLVGRINYRSIHVIACFIMLTSTIFLSLLNPTEAQKKNTLQKNCKDRNDHRSLILSTVILEMFRDRAVPLFFQKKVGMKFYIEFSTSRSACRPPWSYWRGKKQARGRKLC